MTVEEFADRIRASGYRVTVSGDEYRAQCPAHQGKDLNLSIGQGDNGGIVCTCFSHQCTAEQVAAAVGVPMRELMPVQTNGTQQITSRVVERDRYDRADGALAFEVWRYEPKDFKPHHLDARGQWQTGYGTTDRPLFRLPELLAADPREPVFICAGEKDTKNLIRMGLVATTNPGGESARWATRPEWTEPLKGRRCVIVEDLDPVNPKTGKRPGEEHAKEVFAALTASGIRAMRLRLPGLVEGQDASDWVAAGGTAEQLRELIEAWPEEWQQYESMLISGPDLQRSDRPKPEMLVEGVLAKGSVAMFVGYGKQGKTLLLSQLILTLACGGEWLGIQVPKVVALYMNWEDPLDLTKDRVLTQMAGENLPEGSWFIETPYGHSLYAMLEWLEATIQKHGFQLVIIDPIAIAVPWKDEKDPYETGLTMSRLAALAQRTGCAILAVHHTRKAGGESGYEARGSGAIFAGVGCFASLKEVEENTIWELDIINKYAGPSKFFLKRDYQYKTWHATEHIDPEGKPIRRNTQRKLQAIDQVLHAIAGAEARAQHRRDESLRADWQLIRSELSDMPESTLKDHIRELVREGRVFAWNRPTPNAPKHYVYGVLYKSEEECKSQ